jgi:hypothetical protein
MNVANNSQRQNRSAKMSDVLGRPRKRPIDEDTVLSFRVGDALIRALDEEAMAMSAEQPPGRASISRGELIRILLHEGLAAHAKARTKRQ